MKIKVVTLCSGYDSQCLALERLKKNFHDFDYELIAWSEFDPESKTPIERQPAIIAHNALFPQWADRNLGDMTKIDWNEVEDFDLLTYSTPCQSISNAGLQHGFAEGSGTRSSIIWNVRDAVKIKRPKYLLLENVKAMVESKFLPMFNLWQTELYRLGYINFAQVLNAKDYGVPQNRKRIFLFSIRDDGDYPQYNFPEPFPLKIRLKDVLEQNVDEKYYLSDKMLDYFTRVYKGKTIHPYESFYWNTTQKFFRGQLGGGIARCVKCDDSLATLVMKQTEDITVQQVGNIVENKENGFSNPQRGRVYSPNGLAPCLNTVTGGGLEPKVIEPTIMAMRGRNPDHPSERGKSNRKYKQRLEMNNNGTSNTLTGVQKDNLVVEPKIIQKFGDRGTDQYSIRDYAHTIPVNPMSDRQQMVIEPEVMNPLKGQTDNGWHYEQQIYSEAGITRAVKAGGGSGNIPKVIVEDNEQWKTITGNKQLNPFRGSVDGTSPCITSACGMGGGMTPMLTDADLETTKQKEFIEQIRGHKEMEYRIRKLTPKECFRLMGVDDEDIDKIQASGISNSSQYKLAGNSIVVDVLYHIFRKAFVEKDNESQQLTFF